MKQRLVGWALCLCLSLGAFAASLMIAETVFRRFFSPKDPRLSIPYVKFDAGKDFAAVSSKDSELLVQIPNNEFKLRGAVYRINSLGLRGPEQEREKKPGSTRILMLGDSVTFGLFIPDETQVFARILERELRSFSPEKSVEVLNAGMSGYQAEQYLRYFRHHGSQLGSDYVVLNLVPYDCSTYSIIQSENYRHFRILADDGSMYPKAFPLPRFINDPLMEHSLIFRALNFQVHKFLEKYRTRTPEIFFTRFGDCMKTVKSVTREIDRQGAECLIALHPMLIGKSWHEANQSNERFNVIREIAAHACQNIIDIQEAYRLEGVSPKSVAIDNIHPNELGNKIIAEQLTKWFESRIAGRP